MSTAEVKLLPIPSGPYSVGCADIMTKGTPEESVFFRLFYPISKQEISSDDMRQLPLAVPRHEYLNGFSSIAGIFRKPATWLLRKITDNWRSPAKWYEPLLPEEEMPVEMSAGFPVVILAHGYGGFRAFYSTMCCHLASHGYVVAAVEARDGTAGFSYYYQEDSAGNLIEKHVANKPVPLRPALMNKPQAAIDEHWPQFNRQVHHCSDECLRALGILSGVHMGIQPPLHVGHDFPLEQFKNRLDLDKVAIIGQSFGGGTAITAARKERQFKVCIVLDPFVICLDREPVPVISQPLLMILSEDKRKGLVGESFILDILLHKHDPMLDRKVILVKESRHSAQCDFLFEASGWMGQKFIGNINPTLCNKIQNSLILAFLRKSFGTSDTLVWDKELKKYKDYLEMGLPKSLQHEEKSKFPELLVFLNNSINGPATGQLYSP